MSVSPDRTAPCAPYVEDCDDSQDEKSAAPPRANTAKKVTRRDEASDSGYSSHTVATGSSSQGSRGKKPPPVDRGGFFSRMGKKSTPAPKKASTKDSATKESTRESPVSPKTTRLGRAAKKDDLRSAAAAAGHEAKKPSPTKKRPVVPPVETRTERRESSSRPASATRPRPAAIIYHDPEPPMISPPQPDPRPRMYTPRQRPYSYYEGMVPGPPPTLGYHDQPPMYPQMMPPGVYPAPGPAHPYPVPMLQPASPTNRIINYSMPHTSPPFMGSHGWDGPCPHPPPSSRRLSMVSPPVSNSLVSYPRVPRGHGWQDRQYGLQDGYALEYAPLEASSRYDSAILTPEEESFYRHERRRELDAQLMPPPPKPLRPTLPVRSATVTASGRSKRSSYEPRISQSPRKTSFDANSRPPSRPGPAHRSSHSSNEPAPPTAPSPTVRRRVIGHSRPTSYHESHDKYQAAEAYQERTGTASTNMTADAVKNVVRQKSSTAQSKTKQSTRSHSSRTSSKSSDPKKKPAGSEKSRDSSSRDGVTLKIGKMMLGVKGGRSFHVRQDDDNVHIRLGGESSRSRDGRGKDRAQGTKYQASGSTNSRGERGEVEVHRSSRPRSRSHSRRRPATNEDASAASTRGDGEPTERVRTQSRSRRSSSRSGRRPVDF